MIIPFHPQRAMNYFIKLKKVDRNKTIVMNIKKLNITICHLVML